MDGPLAPSLEMLWEARDPTEVITERFGFHDGGAAGRWVVDVLDEYWGLRVGSCEKIVMSGQNALAWVSTSAGRMVTKWSIATERFPRLAALAELTHWLDDGGLPVSKPVASLDGRLQVEVGGASMGLQGEIAGLHLDTRSRDQVRAAGAHLARLHDALAVYPPTGRINGLVDPPTPVGERIERWHHAIPGRVPERARQA